MSEIDAIRERLEAVGELPELLAAAWDAFGVLVAACQDGEDRSAELFAAFAFAAAAAAEGRLIIASAPSRPAGPGERPGNGTCGEADLEKFADSLAGLARRLAERLSSAACQAPDPGDRDACELAAAEAARVGEMLERDRS
jgi:hypothetical protein